MELLLDEATDPYNERDNVKESLKFAHHIKPRKESYTYALNLIIHKIRTWNKNIAHQAINVLETCIDECGIQFVYAVSKNNFLNQIIRIIHPNYDAKFCPEDVKFRLMRIITDWNIRYRDIKNIRNSFDQLTKNKIITDEMLHKNVPPLIPHPIMGDEYSNIELSQLLKNPKENDIRRAQKLIKEIVNTEEKRLNLDIEKVTKFQSIQENCLVINEIIQNNPFASDSLNDILKELHQHCMEFLKKLQVDCDTAAATDDPLLGEMLKTADAIINVDAKYQEYIKQQSDVQLISFDDVETMPSAPSILDCPSAENLGFDTNTMLTIPPPSYNSVLPSYTLENESLDPFSNKNPFHKNGW